MGLGVYDGGMRIIAGQFRGRKLSHPEGMTTRPITDRVKQSLFDMVNPHIPDAVVFDVFAGAGSMGLESLSRGAKTAYFFEADFGAIKQLKANIGVLKLTGEQAVVVGGDLFKWFGKEQGVKGDLVFLDPPYRYLREKPEELRGLAERLKSSFLADGALVVFRHDAEDRLELPALRKIEERSYGSMVIELMG